MRAKKSQAAKKKSQARDPYCGSDASKAGTYDVDQERPPRNPQSLPILQEDGTLDPEKPVSEVPPDCGLSLNPEDMAEGAGSGPIVPLPKKRNKRARASNNHAAVGSQKRRRTGSKNTWSMEERIKSIAEEITARVSECVHGMAEIDENSALDDLTDDAESSSTKAPAEMTSSVSDEHALEKKSGSYRRGPSPDIADLYETIGIQNRPKRRRQAGSQGEPFSSNETSLVQNDSEVLPFDSVGADEVPETAVVHSLGATDLDPTTKENSSDTVLTLNKTPGKKTRKRGSKRKYQKSPSALKSTFATVGADQVAISRKPRKSATSCALASNLGSYWSQPVSIRRSTRSGSRISADVETEVDAHNHSLLEGSNGNGSDNSGECHSKGDTEISSSLESGVSKPTYDSVLGTSASGEKENCSNEDQGDFSSDREMESLPVSDEHPKILHQDEVHAGKSLETSSASGEDCESPNDSEKNSCTLFKESQQLTQSLSETEKVGDDSNAVRSVFDDGEHRSGEDNARSYSVVTHAVQRPLGSDDEEKPESSQTASGDLAGDVPRSTASAIIPDCRLNFTNEFNRELEEDLYRTASSSHSEISVSSHPDCRKEDSIEKFVCDADDGIHDLRGSSNADMEDRDLNPCEEPQDKLNLNSRTSTCSAQTKDGSVALYEGSRSESTRNFDQKPSDNLCGKLQADDKRDTEGNFIHSFAMEESGRCVSEDEIPTSNDNKDSRDNANIDKGSSLFVHAHSLPSTISKIGKEEVVDEALNGIGSMFNNLVLEGDAVIENTALIPHLRVEETSSRRSDAIVNFVPKTDDPTSPDQPGSTDFTSFGNRGSILAVCEKPKAVGYSIGGDVAISCEGAIENFGAIANVQQTCGDRQHVLAAPTSGKNSTDAPESGTEKQIHSSSPKPQKTSEDTVEVTKVTSENPLAESSAVSPTGGDSKDVIPTSDNTIYVEVQVDDPGLGSKKLPSPSGPVGQCFSPPQQKEVLVDSEGHFNRSFYNYDVSLYGYEEHDWRDFDEGLLEDPEGNSEGCPTDSSPSKLKQDSESSGPLEAAKSLLSLSANSSHVAEGTPEVIVFFPSNGDQYYLESKNAKDSCIPGFVNSQAAGAALLVKSMSDSPESAPLNNEEVQAIGAVVSGPVLPTTSINTTGISNFQIRDGIAGNTFKDATGPDPEKTEDSRSPVDSQCTSNLIDYPSSSPLHPSSKGNLTVQPINSAEQMEYDKCSTSMVTNTSVTNGLQFKLMDAAVQTDPWINYGSHSTASNDNGMSSGLVATHDTNAGEGTSDHEDDQPPAPLDDEKRELFRKRFQEWKDKKARGEPTTVDPSDEFFLDYLRAHFEYQLKKYKRSINL